MGLLWPSVAPLVSALIGELFGLKHFDALFGIFFNHQLGSFAGTWIEGAVRDFKGSYSVARILMIAFGSLAFAVQ